MTRRISEEEYERQELNSPYTWPTNDQVRAEGRDPDTGVPYERIDPDDVDFRIRNEGTLVLLWPISDVAKSWVLENVAVATEWGGAVVIEHRYAQAIIDGATADGLVFGGVS